MKILEELLDIKTHVKEILPKTMKYNSLSYCFKFTLGVNGQAVMLFKHRAVSKDWLGPIEFVKVQLAQCPKTIVPTDWAKKNDFEAMGQHLITEKRLTNEDLASWGSFLREKKDNAMLIIDDLQSITPQICSHFTFGNTSKKKPDICSGRSKNQSSQRTAVK